jgi:hypothetical protein
MIRFVVGVAGGVMLLTGVLSLGERVTAQASLPLANLGIEHLDIVVPDPAASTLRQEFAADAEPSTESVSTGRRTPTISEWHNRFRQRIRRNK